MSNMDSGLPGLERLISLCKALGFPRRLNPPLSEALVPKATLLGQPFDPILARMLARFDGGFLHEMFLFPFADVEMGIESFNSRWRAQENRVQEILLYGKIDGLPCYFATVPSRSDERGRQPVIYLEAYEGIRMLPIASSVDKVFDLYARYLDTVGSRYGSIEAAEEDDDFRFYFPGSIPELVARDSRLLQMLELKQFEFLTAWDERSTEWIARVQREARRLT